MNPLNQFSYVIIAALALLVLAAGFWWTGFTRRKWLALGAAAAACLVLWAGLRTGASAWQDPRQAETAIRESELPVLIEFYSDYCAGCLAAKPTLDSLEEELKGELTIIRLDVASVAGRELGRELNLLITPTFILFDAQGNELWRMLGGLDASAVREALGKS